MDADGMVVFDEPSASTDLKAYCLPRKYGVVLGRIFPMKLSQEPAPSPLLSDERDAERFTSSGGRAFMEEYWGAYVAFFNDSLAKCRHVVRDCSGKLPCFRLRVGAASIVFSDINDIRALPGINLVINWKYIAAFLYYERLEIRDCGIENVTEILAGDVLQFRNETVEHRSGWNPARYAHEPWFDEPARASGLLRDTTLRCINEWSAVYSTIIHSLSGGFDSSVVLGCLSLTPNRTRITCLNRYSELPSEDERSFARLAASNAGVMLTELHLNHSGRLLDERLLDLPPSVKPSLAVFASGLDIDERNELARDARAEATWTGQGGDHLFLAERTPTGAADFLRLRGLRRGLFAAVADAARLTGESYRSVARSAVADWRTRPSWMDTNIEIPKTIFAQEEAMPANIAEYIKHPWMDDVEDLPSGKQAQIYDLAQLLNRHRPIGNLEVAPEHHPLLSQPLIELCLHLPTYSLLTGGRPRGLAREAFRDVVPLAILNRQAKGAVTSFWMQMLHRSSAFLQELLYDGMLRKQNLIDVTQFEPYLRHRQPVPLNQFAGLVACITAEVWARSWHKERLQVAA